MRSDMVPGAIFPDYELSDHTAKHRKLSELQGQDPMVLVLSRGAFCPKDRRQAEGLLQLHREMEVGYCRLVTISTDNITQTNENRSGIGAHWPFLSDPRRIVQKDLDIAEYTDPVNNPMIPHVIVLEPGLVIHKIYNGYWFFGRPTMEELRQDLRAVSRKCRPDWDITTPELKAAWQEGRKEFVLSVRQNLCSNSRRTGARSWRWSRARPRLVLPFHLRTERGGRHFTLAAPRRCNSVRRALGINPGTPVSTTELNLTFVVMRSRISRMASSGRAEISKFSWIR